MYAKLVTNSSSTPVFSEYANTLVGVITGSITSTASLPTNSFNQSSSTIISTVAPGWELYDNNASAAIATNSPGKVIRAPWSDSGSNYKYIWTNMVSASTYPQMMWIPGEGWSNTSHTGTNMLTSIPTTSIGGTRTWYSSPYYMSSGQSTGFTTIISASSNHLFIWVSSDLTGLTFNSHVFFSEYTRDDPWNTVSNGYPAWMGSGSNGGGTFGSGTDYDNGSIIRHYNTYSGSDINHLSMGVGSDYSQRYWGLASKLRPRGYTSVSSAGSDYFPSSLGNSGKAVHFFGNNGYARDASKNLSYLLSDIRVEQWTYGLSQYGMQAYGSVTAKSPYVYLFRSQWQSLDEVDISGVRYTNLILNSSTPGTSASTVLIKQV